MRKPSKIALGALVAAVVLFVVALPFGNPVGEAMFDLVPAGHEHGLGPPAARDARPPVPAVGGQDLAQHAPAKAEQRGPEHRLRRIQAGAAAAQGPGRLGGETA